MPDNDHSETKPPSTKEPSKVSERSSNEELIAEGSEEAPEPAPSSTDESEEPSAPVASTKTGWWSKLGSEARVAVISAIAVALVGGAFSPVGHWIAGAFDEVRDFTRSYDGRRLDDMKETIENRPFWQEGPSFSGNAFDYVDATDESEEPYVTLAYDSTFAKAVGVDDLVDEAPDLTGVPVILVGRVSSESLLEANGYSPYIRREIVLTGSNHYVYVGTDSSSYSWHGIAAYVGVLLATGRAFDDKAPAGVPTAYFIGVKGVSVSPRDQALRSELRDLDPGAFE